MQLAFSIHVIITLLMLKPATSKTCDNATWKEKNWSFCPKTNMYFTELPMTELQTGECCEAVDPSYANQQTTCSFFERPRNG